MFGILTELFIPVDIVAVTRRNKTLLRRHWHEAAVEHNYFLRGFNYLFIMFKGDGPHGGEKGASGGRGPGGNVGLPDRRAPEEIAAHLRAFGGKEGQ